MKKILIHKGVKVADTDFEAAKTCSNLKSGVYGYHPEAYIGRLRIIRVFIKVYDKESKTLQVEKEIFNKTNLRIHDKRDMMNFIFSNS